MKINPFVFGAMVLALFLGVTAGFQSAGIWSVSGKVDSGGGRVEPSSEDAATIKGWMTLQQVSDAFNIPVADILAAFNLPGETPASTPIKDLESDTFSVADLRTWLAGYQSTAP